MAEVFTNGVSVSEEKMLVMGDKLKDPKVPMSERFRILFTLRNINNPLAVLLIGNALSDPSVLLKHELAYCLGQMGDGTALPVLSAVLENEDEDPMVRHEAGEALGAIGKPESKEILSKYAQHSCQEIAETCQLALKRIQELESASVVDDSVYKTSDPAFSIKSLETGDSNNIAELKDLLLDPKTSLYNRYQAMFTLRNIGSEAAINALCEGLKDSTSALFRHEIAFVLGQMQSPHSTAALAECLAKLDENEMVRHECAEALGAIGTPESREVLEKYLQDSRQVVKESVYVALDICDYEQSGSFQYADALSR
jgi:deoxyhypusine monooxygenase